MNVSQTMTETLKPEIKTFTTHTSEPHWPPALPLTEPALLEKVQSRHVSSLPLRLGCLSGSVPVLVLKHFKHTSCSGSFTSSPLSFSSAIPVCGSWASHFLRARLPLL